MGWDETVVSASCVISGPSMTDASVAGAYPSENEERIGSIDVKLNSCDDVSSPVGSGRLPVDEKNREVDLSVGEGSVGPSFIWVHLSFRILHLSQAGLLRVLAYSKLSLALMFLLVFGLTSRPSSLEKTEKRGEGQVGEGSGPADCHGWESPGLGIVGIGD